MPEETPPLWGRYNWGMIPGELTLPPAKSGAPRRVGAVAVLRWLGFGVGLLASVPLAILVIFAFVTPLTGLGAAYLGLCSLVALGALTAPWRVRRRRGLCRLGLLGLALIAAVRPAGVRSGPVRLTTLPGDGGPRAVDRLLEERDVALFGAQGFRLAGLHSAAEHDGLVACLSRAYAAMPGAIGPTAGTFLLGQSTRSFSAVVCEPPDVPRLGVVYLHGMGGNFSLQTLLVGGLFRREALVVSPSTNWRGDWQTPRGAAAVAQAVRYLRTRGVGRVYLVGLSMGGFGASHLGPAMRSELAGMVLLSGLDPMGPRPTLPTLVIHGRRDEQMPARYARWYATRGGHAVSYSEVDGDHYMLAKRHDEIARIVGAWLTSQERGRAEGPP